MDTDSDHKPVAYDPTVDAARRINFMLVTAERALGCSQEGYQAGEGLPFAARLEQVLAGAMHQPEAVSPSTYRLIYMLAGRG